MLNFDFAAWRSRLGITQEQAADALGMSRCQYQQNEVRHNYSLGRVQSIKQRTVMACMWIEHLHHTAKGKICQ